jgi:hypothetical protein
MNENEPTYVVYTLDEHSNPGHFLEVVEGTEELEAAEKKWWKAFRSGEKLEPKNYEGISHRPVARFDEWAAGDGGESE